MGVLVPPLLLHSHPQVDLMANREKFVTMVSFCAVAGAVCAAFATFSKFGQCDENRPSVDEPQVCLSIFDFKHGGEWVRPMNWPKQPILQEEGGTPGGEVGLGFEAS